MDMFIVNDIAAVWLIVAALLLTIEIFAGGIIGFLFAGLGALITGILLEFHFIPRDNVVTQLIVFCLSSLAMAAILWKPLKNFRNRYSGDPYNNMVGTTAKVVDHPLKKGKTGSVKWSGTFMRAKLASHSVKREIPIDTEVTVIEVKGNKLIVEPID